MSEFIIFVIFLNSYGESTSGADISFNSTANLKKEGEIKKM